MASFRSNLNSVPIVTYGLTAIKKRFTTCFQNWCQKHLKQQQHDLFGDITFNGFKIKKIFYTKKTKNFENFHLKSEKSVQPQQQQHQELKYQSEKIEIVAKLLLSSTLVTATTTTTTSETTTETNNKAISTVTNQIEAIPIDFNSSDMTITDDTFLQIRDEYPDLETEIRSILIARAQEGATIANIREDYKKITGMSFPIYNNITDFLLNIPRINVFVNDRGTRIFTIVPNEKTKHIHDMVLEQKPPAPRPNYFKRYHNDAYDQQRHYGRIQTQDINNKNYNNIEYYAQNYHHNSNYNNNNCVEQQQQQKQQQEQQVLKRPRSDKTSSESTGSVVEYNCFYEDNYHYLNNRFNNQQMQHYLLNDLNEINNNLNMNNFNTNNINNNNNNDIEHFKDVCAFANEIAQQTEFKIPDPPRIVPKTNLITTAIQPQVINPFKQPQQQQQQRQHNLNVRGIYSSPSGTKSSQYNTSTFTQDSDYEAHLLDFPLLGDDFFLYLARMELKCKFKKYEKVLQSGFCVSGQSISAAIKRLRHIPSATMLERRFIVNIGSVDIMQGKPLVQIEHDFRELLNVMFKKGIKPILTTLAPLANYSHIAQMKERLERFNEFIKKECKNRNLLVVDIWSCLVNQKNQTRFDCFQHEPRMVTGTNEPYVFWNKIGRQRVLQEIESKLEY